MQARAIFEAAVEAGQRTGKPVVPEVMVPLIATRDGVRPRQGAHRRHRQGGRRRRRGTEIDYQVGTMIELPRAALMAGEIARDRGVLLLRHQRPHPDHVRHQPRRCRELPRHLYRQGHPARSIRSSRSIATASASWCGSRPSAAARCVRTSSSASAASTAATPPRSRSATRSVSTTSPARRSACRSRAWPPPRPRSARARRARRSARWSAQTPRAAGRSRSVLAGQNRGAGQPCRRGRPHPGAKRAPGMLNEVEAALQRRRPRAVPLQEGPAPGRREQVLN